jgi:hypothetical protein
MVPARSTASGVPSLSSDPYRPDGRTTGAPLAGPRAQPAAGPQRTDETALPTT